MIELGTFFLVLLACIGAATVAATPTIEESANPMGRFSVVRFPA